MLSELRSYLLADPAVTALVGQRMHPESLPQNVTYPALSFAQVSAVRERDLCGPAGFAHPRVTINSWAETYAVAHQLATAVRQALDGFHGEAFVPAGVRIGSVRIDNELDGDEPEIGLYRVLQDYIISHSED